MSEIYILWIVVLVCVTIIAITGRICAAVERKYTYQNILGKGFENFVNNLGKNNTNNDFSKYMNKTEDNNNGQKK